MKVQVNKDLCIGCGQCEAVASNIFEIGNEGVAEVITDNIKEEEIDEVKGAIDGCPVDAISEIK